MSRGRNFQRNLGDRWSITPALFSRFWCLDLGKRSPVAGGGRYDGLMRMCGAPADVAAVGGAIHTERLLKAVRG